MKNNKKGLAVITWIMLVLTIVMTVVVVTPAIVGAGESANVAADLAYESQAKSDTRVEMLQSGAFCAIYDSVGKQFVYDSKLVSAVMPYGSSKENKNKVILVQVDDAGGVKMSWVDLSNTDTLKSVVSKLSK